MHKLKATGKFFYGVGIAGIGGLQFIYAGFRPVLLPIPAADTMHLNFLVYLAAGILVVAGLYIAIGQQVKNVALLLGLFFLLFFIFGHLPNRIKNNPGELGAWTDALKLLTLAGGAFVVATVYPAKKGKGLISVLEKIAPFGKYLFALMLVIFGIDHFLYADFVKFLVPNWIPGPLFWTYVGGVALIGAGLAIFLNIQPRLISLLLATMLLIWLVILHIPRAIVAPATDNGNERTSVFQCLLFSGIALMYPYVRVALKGGMDK